MAKHWTQTAAGKKIMALAQKKAWKSRRKNGRVTVDKVVGAEHTIRKELKRNGRPKAAAERKHIIHLLLSDSDGLHRSKTKITTWGELFDMFIRAELGGEQIQEIYIEANV
jgi:hypothetical protein